MRGDLEFIQTESKKLQNMKKIWEEQRIEMGGDKIIIQFISNILFHGGIEVSAENAIETIRNLFESGYCYYMAKMLEEAFPGGQICLCYPYGHIVYAYEGIAYDINGVSDAEYEMYIPLTELGAAVNDFKHIPCMDYNITEDELDTIGEQCKRNHTYIHAISAYDKEIVKRSRAVCEEVTETPYISYKNKYIIEKNRLIKELQDGYITKEQFDDFINKRCQEIGLSYPLIQRIEREKILTAEAKLPHEQLMQKLIEEVKEEEYE